MMNEVNSDDEIPDLVSLPTELREERVESATPDLPPLDRKLIPVTLITGFLGSGKSTLVRYVLSADHGYKIAVIVNEFGDSSGIEQSVIESPGEEKRVVTDWLELSNGCLCCSVKSDFVAALEGLVAEGRDRFDYVLIETTGLANPGPVAASLWTDEELESEICLDSIVTVVDAKNIMRHLTQQSSKEAEQQLAYADLVILNKVDLVEEEEARKIEEEIRSINRSAEVQRSIMCEIDLKVMFNRRAFSVEAATKLPEAEPDCDHSSDCDHDSEVRTVSLEIQAPLHRQKFELWLSDMLWTQSDSIYRAKAVLNFADSQKRHILQAVHELYDITEGIPWSVEETPHTKMVFIGRHLDRDSLLGSLLSLKQI